MAKIIDTFHGQIKDSQTGFYILLTFFMVRYGGIEDFISIINPYHFYPLWRGVMLAGTPDTDDWHAWHYVTLHSEMWQYVTCVMRGLNQTSWVFACPLLFRSSSFTPFPSSSVITMRSERSHWPHNYKVCLE